VALVVAERAKGITTVTLFISSFLSQSTARNPHFIRFSFVGHEFFNHFDGNFMVFLERQASVPRHKFWSALISTVFTATASSRNFYKHRHGPAGFGFGPTAFPLSTWSPPGESGSAHQSQAEAKNREMLRIRLLVEQFMMENRAAVEAVANALIERKTLIEAEINQLLNRWAFVKAISAAWSLHPRPHLRNYLSIALRWASSSWNRLTPIKNAGIQLGDETALDLAFYCPPPEQPRRRTDIHRGPASL
jgi:hypothetical protein